MMNQASEPAKKIALPLEKSSTAPPTISVSGPPGMLTGRRGVPLSVPLPFLLTSVCAAGLFGVLLPWIVPEAMQASGFPHVLTLVHLTTLGWLTMAIMGASLQLTPVIVVAPLHATRFIKWHYPIFVSGVVLLLSGFWWMRAWLMIAGGTLVVLAVIHYVVILAVTLARATTRPLTVRYLAASLLYLCVVVGLGLTVALNLQFNFLTLDFNALLLTHLTLGIVGWLTCTLIGVSYTLVRLFALVHGHNDRIGARVFILLNVGIVGLALGFIFYWLPLIIVSGGALIVATWLFAYDYVQMLRMRRRKVLDVTQYHSMAAVVYLALLIPSGLLATLFDWQQPSVLTALALAALVGWLGQSILGYLYKIVPFLIWHTRYGPVVGLQKVPLMREMVHERWAWTGWWLINAGLPLVILYGLLTWTFPLQIASGLLGCGLVLAAVNVIAIVRHLDRRYTPSLHKAE